MIAKFDWAKKNFWKNVNKQLKSADFFSKKSKSGKTFFMKKNCPCLMNIHINFHSLKIIIIVIPAVQSIKKWNEWPCTHITASKKYLGQPFVIWPPEYFAKQPSWIFYSRDAGSNRSKKSLASPFLTFNINSTWEKFKRSRKMRQKVKKKVVVVQNALFAN